MIDPKSIERVYKNEEAVLKALIAGENINFAAKLCGVSPKTAWCVRKKYADRFPKKEKPPKKSKGKPLGWRKPGPKSVQRSMRVPGELDASVCKEARKRSMEYHHLIFEILRGRYSG